MHCKTDVRLVVFLISLSLAFGASCCVSAADVMTPAVDIEKTLKLLDHEDAVIVGKAALDLGRSKNSSPAVIAALVKHLDDRREAIRETLLCAPIPTVADYASRALQSIASEAAVRPICRLLKHTKCKETKRLVLHLLGNLGPIANQSMETLLPYTKDRDTDVRYYALRAIGAVSTEPKEVVPLLRLALTDENTSVQSIAIFALGNIGPKAADAVPDLVPLLESNKYHYIAFTPDMWLPKPLYVDVTEALEKIGPSAKAAIPKLKSMLHDQEDARRRVEAASALCQIAGDREGLELLLKELEKDFGESTKPDLAAEKLGYIKQDDLVSPALEGLKKALQHREEEVRAIAIEAIGRISPPEVVTLLVPFAKDDSTRVRAAVIRVLSDHANANPELLEVLVECLSNKSLARNEDGLSKYEDQEEAALALGKMGGAGKAIPILQEYAAKENVDMMFVQEAAQKALKMINEAKKKAAKENSDRTKQ